jgi:hypothetical protein
VRIVVVVVVVVRDTSSLARRSRSRDCIDGETSETGFIPTTLTGKKVSPSVSHGSLPFMH